MASKIDKIAYTFDPKHSEVMAVCCSDGRYIRALEEFLLTKGINGHDLIALPGGPARLHRESSSYTDLSVSTDFMEFLVRSHHSKVILLIAHADCGYYKYKFGVADEGRQKEDLRRVGTLIRERYTGIQAGLYFARPEPIQHGSGFLIEEIV